MTNWQITLFLFLFHVEWVNTLTSFILNDHIEFKRNTWSQLYALSKQNFVWYFNKKISLSLQRPKYITTLHLKVLILLDKNVIIGFCMRIIWTHWHGHGSLSQHLLTSTPINVILCQFKQTCSFMTQVQLTKT